MRMQPKRIRQESEPMNVALQIQSVARRPLHLDLVDQLRTLIVEGALAPGTKVPERELCEKFGVSRTPLREALKVLAVDGLISLEPNRGAWVRHITLEELEDLFPVIGALEALSGELACQCISDAQIEAVRTFHGEMVLHYEARDLAAYFRSNQQIHEAVLDAANNSILSAQHQSLAIRIRRARYLANMTDARWKSAVEEHELILSALSKRQGTELAEILKRHLANKFETVRAWILENNPS